MHAILVERTDMCTLIQALRDKLQLASIDIAALGKFLHSTHQSSTSKGASHPTVTEGSAALADEIMAFLQQKVKDSKATQAEKIVYLEQQLAQAQASASPTRKRSAEPNIPLTPNKKQKSGSASGSPNLPTTDDALICSTNVRPLANEAPKSGHAQTVRTWIKSLQANMIPGDAKKMDSYIESVVHTWGKADKSKRPAPKDLAAQWGLPVIQAVEFSDPTLIKVSAAAAWQVVYNTA